MYYLIMTNIELLKAGRDLLLSLHKSLVDYERWVYEERHGKITSGQFLNLLIEDADLAWLRKFSALIVDIDEMFAQEDGFAEEAVAVHLSKLRDLSRMNVDDESFITRFKQVLQQDLDAAAKQGELKGLLSGSE